MHRRERARNNVIDEIAATAGELDKTGAMQDAKVVGDRRLRVIELPGKVTRGPLTAADEFENASS